MFVLQELLGLEFKHVVGAEVWHEDVTMVTNLSNLINEPVSEFGTNHVGEHKVRSGSMVECLT